MIDESSSRDDLIPIAQAARLLMVTEEWIRRLQKQGYIPKDPRGMVSLIGAVQGYITFLKDEERRTSKSAAASKVQDARAEEIALRVERGKKELLAEARAEVIALTDILVGGFKADLLAIPAQVTNDLALRRAIENRVNDACAAAAKRAADALAGPVEGDEVAAPTAAVEPRRVGKGKPRLPAQRRRSRAA